jgi:cytochrome c peroxidase
MRASSSNRGRRAAVFCFRRLAFVALTAGFIAGCSPKSEAPSPSPAATVAQPAAAPTPAFPAARPVQLSLAAQVGKRMFFDASLSGSKKLSCASCHDPQADYAAPNDLAVQKGGVGMTAVGVRTAPSLRYRDITPAYADLLDNPDGISQPGPGGGFTWDGRADSLAVQAALPLLDPNEMANPDRDAVVAAVKSGPYADLFRQAFGNAAFDDARKAFDDAGRALEAYQLEDPDFHPYSSKFDRYAANKIGGDLTPAEKRGLMLFSDPKTGNCASCHYQGAGLSGSSALFTDFSYEAIGVPRNREIAANADPKYFDLGVCGPLRRDHLPAHPGAKNTFCGMFKAPSLRNVDRRHVFFHNGVMHSLEQAIRFYNTRDTHPELWYPTVGGRAKDRPDADFPTYGLIRTQYVGGHVEKYDDLPPAYRANIDPQMPLDGRRPQSKPPMSEQDIADLICFLKTLDDGYQPQAAPPTSGPCTQ